MSFWRRKRESGQTAGAWGPEPPGSTVALTRDVVEKLLADSAECFVKKDVRRMAELLDPELKATHVIKANGLKNETSVRRNGYLTQMAALANVATYPFYKLTITRVLEQSPLRWKLECRSEFAVEAHEQTSAMTSREEVTIELRNGHPKVTELLMESTQ